MGSIYLFDCTLSEGGAANNWMVGDTIISDIVGKLEKSNVKFIEIGVLSDEANRKNRCVYNGLEQISKPKCHKNEDTIFSVRMDFSSRIKIDRISARNSDSFIDMIRLNIEYDNIVNCLQYCQEIKEKGYKLCLCIGKIHLLTKEEFANNLKNLQDIGIDIVCLCDTFGVVNTTELLDYIQIFDQECNSNIALGYCGYNNLNYNFAAMQLLCSKNMQRDIFIDTSIGGLGKYAGILGTEMAAVYINNKLKDTYKVDLLFEVKELFSKMYNVNPNPNSNNMNYYLTASYECNPMYGYYYGHILNITQHEMNSTFSKINDYDKIHFSEEIAQKYLKQQRKSFWKHKLCLIVPTANRPHDINFYLETVGEQFYNCGIDLIIYDSSSDDSVEKIVTKFIKIGYENIFYKRYEGFFDGISIDEKVISAYKEYLSNYEYIWICRDGFVVNILEIYNYMYLLCQQDYDLMIFYTQFQDYENLGWRIYTEPRSLFRDNCRHMAILGTTIVSSTLIKKIIAECPIDKEKNYGLWQPIAFFQYLHDKQFKAINAVMNCYSPNAYATASSFWNKKGKALWQWANRWYNMVTMLPEVYDSYKSEVLHIEMADFHPFDMPQLFIMRANGGLTICKIRENRRYITHVSKTPLWKFYFVAALPKFLIRYKLEHPGSIISRCLKMIYRFSKKIYRMVFLKDVTPILQDITLQSHNENNETSVLPNNRLCIVIPTKGRPGNISNYLEKIGEKVIKHNVALLIYDSSDDDEIKNIIDYHNEKMGRNFVLYKKYTGKEDKKSLDEKVISAYLEVKDTYEYIWIVRDRLVVQLDNIIYDLEKLFACNSEVIAIYNNICDHHNIGNKKYTDSAEFFKEQFAQMTVLGQVIVKSKFIEEVIKQYPLDDQANYSLWQPTALFHYLAHKEGELYSYVSNVFEYQNASGPSFWLVQLLWQWAERFSIIMDLLPEKYQDYKKDVLNEMESHFNLFSIKYLLWARCMGGLNFGEIKYYKKYIVKVTNVELRKFYAIALTPKWLAKAILENPDSFISKFVKVTYLKIKLLLK